MTLPKHPHQTGKPEPLPKVREDSMLRAEFETSQAAEARSKTQNSGNGPKQVR